MHDPEESKYGDGHPFKKTDAADIQDEIDYAFNYAIGQNVDVTNESGQYKGASGEIPWFGIAKITDPDAKIELQKPDSKLVPTAVSAGIIHEEGPDQAISKYHIVHVAAVSSGAYGPRFVHLSKCNGDALSCLPALKAASSYKERNHICPVEVLSSYVQKSASSDINMSALNNASTPGPQSFGSGTMSTSIPGQSNTQTIKPKIRIRINKAPLESENPNGEQPQEQPTGEGQGEGQGQGGEQSNNEGNQATVQSVQKELSALRKQYESQANVWKQDRQKRELQDAIPKALFTDPKGRFRQKDWEKEIESRLQQGLPIDTIREIYQLRMQMLEVPEIAQKSKRASSSLYYYNPVPVPKGASSASSQDNDEDTERKMKLAELGKMVRGV